MKVKSRFGGSLLCPQHLAQSLVHRKCPELFGRWMDGWTETRGIYSWHENARILLKDEPPAAITGTGSERRKVFSFQTSKP